MCSCSGSSSEPDVVQESSTIDESTLEEDNLIDEPEPEPEPEVIVPATGHGKTSSNPTILAVNVNFCTIDLSWDMPGFREDGSILESYEINGYDIFYKALEQEFEGLQGATGAWTDEIGILLSPAICRGLFEFQIRTIDSDNLAGEYSSPLFIMLKRE